MSQYPQYSVPDAKDLLKLGVGQPAPSLLMAAQELLRNGIGKFSNDINLLQYGDKRGFLDFRLAIVKMLATYTTTAMNSDEYIEIAKNNIYMTNGVSQAVTTIASLYRKFTNVIYVEDPTYFLALDVFSDLDYEIRTFDLNKLNEIKLKDGESKCLMYVVPYHQNPTGRCITDEQIKSLKELCDYNPGMCVLSDETYQMLSFRGEYKGMFNACLADVHENIVSIGTFSKIFAPAMRLGWLYSKNREVFKLLDNSGFIDSGGGVNPIIGETMTNILNLQNDAFTTHLAYVNDTLHSRYVVLADALRKYPDYFEFDEVYGGYFIWVKTKKVSAETLLNISSKHGVSFHVGNRFSKHGNNRDYFRLSYSYYSADDLKMFLPRLDAIVYDIDNHLYSAVDTSLPAKKEPVKVHLLGARGRLGNLIVECLKTSETCVLGSCMGRDIDLDSIGDCDREIIVDVSSPEGTTLLLTKLMDKKMLIPLIIGTTGSLPNELISKYSKYAKVYVCPNFSVGAKTVGSMIECVTPKFWNTVTIVDVHHAGKKDKPSGTAKKLAEKVVTCGYTPDIVSLREGDVIGLHEVKFESDSETVTIIHNVKNRDVFAKGCLALIDSIFE
jgi:2-aminoadipate transaminase